MKIKSLIRLFTALVAFLGIPAGAVAQQALPSALPTMTIIAADGTEEDASSYDGSAPLEVLLRANPQDVGLYEPRYEWRITRVGDTAPLLVRYDEDTRYTFSQSGSFSVTLLVSFVQGRDTVDYELDTPFLINISESRLEVPNAFTPNGDGINDVFRVKEGYQSIVSFEAAVFNRWGKRLYEWTDPAGGWDGRSGGHDVPDGAYYLHIKARGADGRAYDIRKTINLLRGFTEGSGATGL